MRPVRLLCALLALGGAGIAVPAPVQGAPVLAAEPLRILLLGDSVTQGSAGDWTWRYRLAQHLTDAGVSFDFVGPREDLWDNLAKVPGSTAYADPGFDRAHASRWGMTAAWADVSVTSLATDYRPDVIVSMLGVNDLIITSETPEEVAARMGHVVTDARAVLPEVDVVLAEATQHWFTDVPEFNAALPVVAGELTTPQAQVVVANASAGYDRLADTWDTSHPNARGEVRIAAAVADALSLLGIAHPAQRPLVLPPVGPRTPGTLTGSAGDAQVTLTWTGPPGATTQRLWSRDATAGGPWTLRDDALPPAGTRTLTSLANGHRWQWRVQPVKGDDEPEGGVFTPVLELLPAAPPVAAVRLVAPAGLRGLAGGRCVRLSWQTVSGASAYRVQRWTGEQWTTGARTTRSRLTFDRLPLQARWRFRVRALRGTSSGPSAYLTVRSRSGRCG